ncbi:MAG: nitroreductase [Deltaproteobacteria bacterium]|nr:nitroreductase [Deltaproteobacteria bacterium]
MDIVEAIRMRKSIRKYKPDPVPKEILSNILEIAVRAPSAMNTQPWEFTVITGKVLENVKNVNIEKLHSGAPLHLEHPSGGWPFESVYRDRQVELGMQLFELMDIPRDDMEKRAAWLERGFRYFDAPAAIIIMTDRVLTEGGPMFDIGTVAQNICLVALTYGLGTCIEDQGIMYPDVLREHAGIPESKRIVMSIAIGYPDWKFPANRLESARDPIERITTWCGFDPITGPEQL